MAIRAPDGAKKSSYLSVCRETVDMMLLTIFTLFFKVAYARVCKSMQKYARENQSMPEYDALIMPEYARVCHSMPGDARVCQSLPEYARVCKSMPEYTRVCQSMMH